MKKIVYVLFLLLAVASGLAFVNRAVQNAGKRFSEPSYVIQKRDKAPENERKKWEASPDGQNYKRWEASAHGRKVRASYDRIKDQVTAFSNLEARVASVSFQRKDAKPSGSKWLIVAIGQEKYMMQFSPKDFRRFRSLKVNDRIAIRSRSAGFSPNHPYLILSGDSIARSHEVLFKRDFNKKSRC